MIRLQTKTNPATTIQETSVGNLDSPVRGEDNMAYSSRRQRRKLRNRQVRVPPGALGRRWDRVRGGSTKAQKALLKPSAGVTKHLPEHLNTSSGRHKSQAGMPGGCKSYAKSTCPG